MWPPTLLIIKHDLIPALRATLIEFDCGKHRHPVNSRETVSARISPPLLPQLITSVLTQIHTRQWKLRSMASLKPRDALHRNIHEYSPLCWCIYCRIPSATWHCVSVGAAANGVYLRDRAVFSRVEKMILGRKTWRKMRVTESLDENTRKGIAAATLTTSSSRTPLSASHVERTMMRLFPPGFTVVDRGSGSLTAQASLSIDRGSSRVSGFRRTRPTRLRRLSPRANGRLASPSLSLISGIGW